ncbi:Molybdenum cofactor biosynthesis, MoeB [Ophiocordyceps camponoti-floridani]|uniref:Ubiquitin-like 1-activating enzyme E1A n=1 Tax=Ophiocordyceps camponoti-floridani TaxID=2030778 RepID=A0A8H4Q8J8_9HYPO|nr:Molybdenum cofactor biosynthesis, MoeB [Ophiocordyceps camponoti-floridani]
MEPSVVPPPQADSQVPASMQNVPAQQVSEEALMAAMANQAFVGQPAQHPTQIPTSTANGNDTLPAGKKGTVSADEVALYDRQIRLWGIDAQAKIQNSSVLLITMRGLANETAKNLVLAGVGSLTLLDDSPVTESDLGAQFLVSAGSQDLGRNRAEAASAALAKLNPRVRIHVDTERVTSKGPGYFAGFDVVIATDLGPDSFNIINTATRLNRKAFYAAGTHGLYGFIFSDLIEHDYVIEREASNVPTHPKQETRTRSIINVESKSAGSKTTESVTKRELYSTWLLASDPAALPDEYLHSRRRLKSVTPALSCLRALWDFTQLREGTLPSTREDLKLFTQMATQKHKALSLPSETLRPEFLRSFLQNLGSEVAPVAAILGGQLAQDVINVLGHTQQPIQNMVVFDGDRMEAAMFPLHPEGALGTSLLSLGAGDAVVPPVDGGVLGMGSGGNVGGDGGRSSILALASAVDAQQQPVS